MWAMSTAGHSISHRLHCPVPSRVSKHHLASGSGVAIQRNSVKLKIAVCSIQLWPPHCDLLRPRPSSDPATPSPVSSRLTSRSYRGTYFTLSTSNLLAPAVGVGAARCGLRSRVAPRKKESMLELLFFAAKHTHVGVVFSSASVSTAFACRAAEKGEHAGTTFFCCKTHARGHSF